MAPPPPDAPAPGCLSWFSPGRRAGAAPRARGGAAPAPAGAPRPAAEDLAAQKRAAQSTADLLGPLAALPPSSEHVALGLGPLAYPNGSGPPQDVRGASEARSSFALSGAPAASPAATGGAPAPAPARRGGAVSGSPFFRAPAPALVAARAAQRGAGERALRSPFGGLAGGAAGGDAPAVLDAGGGASVSSELVFGRFSAAPQLLGPARSGPAPPA